MKIDLITLHAVKNYGSVLQTFATQEKFKSLGHEVKVINYIREDTKDENLVNSWCGNNYIKKIVMLPTIKKWKKVFNGFLEKNINLTKEKYTTESDFEKYPLQADVFCTGSDQVWNTGWNKGVLPPLYLSFVPEDKYKISYSSSFGKDILSDIDIKESKKYIKQYDFISVRESSGLNILKEQYNYDNGTHIVDPTLAMKPEFWRKYSPKRKYKSDYVLVYQLNKNKDFDKFAVEFARRNNLKLIRFCTRYDQIIKPGKSVLIPDVFEFISLIDNAKCVITDSFHATGFSVNLNTEPICIYPNEYGGRIDSFLKLTGLQERRLKGFDDFSIVNRKVDFDKVNKILDIERKKVDDFLEGVLNSEKI